VATGRKRRDPVEQEPQRAGDQSGFSFGFADGPAIRWARHAVGRDPGHGGVSDLGDVDPFRHDREAPRGRRDIDPDELAQLVDQPVTGEERHVVGLPRKALDEVDAKPEMESGVVRAEAPSVEIT